MEAWRGRHSNDVETCGHGIKDNELRLRDIGIAEEQLLALRHNCHYGEVAEGASQLLLGVSRIGRDPWSGKPEGRLTVHRPVEIRTHGMRRTATSVTWRTDDFVRLLRAARLEGLQPGICHTHPGGAVGFSEQDDANERELIDLAQRRNGHKACLTSMLLEASGNLRARVWKSPECAPETLVVRELGSRLVRWPGQDEELVEVPTFLQRQELAIGSQAVQELRGLRVGVVGCGGTGSAVATMLARLGIQRLLLIDHDEIGETNLNRLHGGRRSDVEAGRRKTEVLLEYITSLGLGTKVATLVSAVSEVDCRDGLKSCDVVFGCTDDHWGRMLLNRLAFFYLIPVIDTGLGVDVDERGRLRQLSGRVTVLRPGTPCLICRRHINPRRAHDEMLRHRSKDEYEKRAKQGYVTDTEVATPAMVTFTTETACSAINELLAAVTGTRRDGWAAERTTRYDLDKTRRTGTKADPLCSVCQSQEYWGAGDVDPFLDQIG